jgi:hypothetical protein
MIYCKAPSIENPAEIKPIIDKNKTHFLASSK